MVGPGGGRGRAGGGGVTRDVQPADVVDLAVAPPRAHLAFVADGAPHVVPVRVRRVGGADLVGLADARPDLAGREVHLVRDDGRYWFELRALTVRGVLRATAPEAAASTPSGGLRWYRLEPSRTVAWDYGSLREVDDA